MKNLAKSISLIVMSILIGGCASMAGSAGVNWMAMHPGEKPDYEVAKEQAKNIIRRNLKDPDSAQFMDSTPLFKTLYNFGMGAVGNYEPLWALCVEVNAKNSYGGYTGFQNWIVKFRNGQPVRDELGVMPAEYDCRTGPTQFSRLGK